MREGSGPVAGRAFHFSVQLAAVRGRRFRRRRGHPCARYRPILVGADDCGPGSARWAALSPSLARCLALRVRSLGSIPVFLVEESSGGRCVRRVGPLSLWIRRSLLGASLEAIRWSLGHPGSLRSYDYDGGLHSPCSLPLPARRRNGLRSVSSMAPSQRERGCRLRHAGHPRTSERVRADRMVFRSAALPPTGRANYPRRACTRLR